MIRHPRNTDCANLPGLNCDVLDPDALDRLAAEHSIIAAYLTTYAMARRTSCERTRARLEDCLRELEIMLPRDVRGW